MKKCILPWIHLEATAVGNAKPCCLYKEPIKINGKIANLNNHSIDEVWNSDYMNNLRQQMIQGTEPEGCSACWEMESVGKRSKREISNDWFEHRLDRWNQPLSTPTYFDLKLGTVCNLKCRSCSSYSSSKWAEDEIKIFGKPFNQNLHSYWIEEESPIWNEIEKFIPDIEYFDFTGGEPFLIKKHFEILQKCVDRGYAKNIIIHYNTNGSIQPTERMFEIWDQFKKVEIMFSIDGVEKKFEYLRHPAKWEKLVPIFQSVLAKKKIWTPICYSVSIYNVMYMNEFIRWFKKFGLHDDQLYFNFIFRPEYMNIQSLPNESKIKIKEYLEKTKTGYEWNDLKVKEVIDFMMEKSVSPDLPDQFRDMTIKLDEIRGENFAETFPELNEILKIK